MNIMRLGLLAHHLLVHLTARRHIDHHVTQQLRRARQAPPGLHGLGLAESGLDVPKRRQVLAARHQPMFSKLAFRDEYLAASTNTTAAAHRVNIYPQRTGCLQHRRAQRKAPAPARRGKHHQCLRVAQEWLLLVLFAKLIRGAFCCQLHGGHGPSRHPRRPPAPRGIYGSSACSRGRDPSSHRRPCRP